MLYFIIAGEASGDAHGARFINSLKTEDSTAVFVGMGGDKMAQAGCRICRHYKDMAFMGVVAVLKNLGNISKNFDIALTELLSVKPDVVILIDYPSFNLKIAQWCKRKLPQTKIWYYIPPKAWAWKQWRVHKIARLCDRIMCIFPFETDFYKKYGYSSEYVGNPTKEAIDEWKESHSMVANRLKQIALLPGSRRHEVEKCLPRMLDGARRFPDFQIIVAGAPSLDEKIYKPYLKNGEKLIFEDTYRILNESSVAVVNSGTATLEAALLKCPQVAVYHIALGRLVALIRPFLFKIKYFTLVNIIAGKQVIRELLAYEFTAANVESELRRLLTDEEYKAKQLHEIEAIDIILNPNRSLVF